jgi:hypothetical protein
VQNFVSAAVGMAVAVALICGLSRRARKYDLYDRSYGDRVFDVFVSPTLNDPWGEASRLTFDESCP